MTGWGPVLAGVPVTFDRGLYEADSGALLARMRGLPPTLATVLVIGHNPAIERLAAHLARGPSPQLDRLRLKFPTGALAVLVLDEGEWPALTLGACRLEAFVRPADMDEE